MVKWMLWQWHAAVRVLLSAILEVGRKRNCFKDGFTATEQRSSVGKLVFCMLHQARTLAVSVTGQIGNIRS